MERANEKAWLINGEGTSSKQRAGSRASRKPANSKRTSEQWLAVPEPSVLSREGEGGASNGIRSSPTSNRKLQARLRKAQRELEKKSLRIDELEERVAELEGELGAKKRQAGQRPARKPAPGTRRKASATRTKTSKTARAPKATRSGRRDINRLTFEEFRELGLSVTQSARLIATREMRNGFSSVDELEALSGFSRETVSELKQQVMAPS